MRLAPLGRAISVAVSLALGTVSGAFAHSLPDSVLTLSQAEAGLSLSITLPLEDLVIADPGLRDLQEADVGSDLPPAQVARIQTYFLKHLALRTPHVVPLDLARAQLRLGYNDHVGEHILLHLKWTAPVDLKADTASLSLLYTAVMHEVRNHRAVVFWDADAAEPTFLTEFGFQGKNGSEQPIVLELPDEAER